MCLAEGIPGTIIQMDFEGEPSKEFMRVLGAQEKSDKLEFMGEIPEDSVRVVMVNPSKGLPVRVFVCAGADAVEFLTSEAVLASRGYYWVPWRNLPAKTVCLLEELEAI